MNTSPKRRIYVASLADYTAGKLHGTWIDVSKGKEHVRSEIQAMLAKSSEAVAEEWAIHDCENFDGLSLSEWSDIDIICEVTELLDEHGTVFAGLVEHFGGLPSGIEEARTAMEESYCGEFRSVTEFVEQHVEDCYAETLRSLPEILRYHIDYEAIAHDMMLSGDIFTIDLPGSLHVFWSR